MTFRPEGSLKNRIGVLMYQTSRSKGQELVAQRMVRYFNKLGHEAYLITSIYHDEKEVVSESVLRGGGWTRVDDEDLGIPVIRVDSYVSNWPPRRVLFKDVLHTLETIVNNFGLDVLITHSTLWNGPEEVAKFVQWRRNMKSLGGYQDPIVFCHMSHFQEPSPKRYSLVERSFRMAWNRISLAQILRVANLILVVTPQEQDAKVKMGAHSDRCVLFPGGVDDDSFMKYATSSPEELLQRFNLGPETKIVSYLGTIEERKNPMGVLEVAEKLRDRTDIHFVIAGRGDSEYADKIRNRAEQLANATYMGEISEKEKLQLIKASYLNILLSRMEALGLAQLEFMFQGVPVITSGVGGQSWIVRNGRDGIHVNGPADVEGAARAVVELVGDRSRWQRCSANAKERASDFTFTKLISELDAAITEDIESETGLAALPSEVRSTLSKPETVARTWSHGTKKVAATNERLFIQQGLLSRSTLEIPYSSINSIEHMRRYRWGTLLIGAGLSFVMFIQHYVSPIMSRTLTSKLVFLVTTIVTSMVPTIKPQLSQILANLWLIPISIALLLFLTGARRGFALHGARLIPIYLPQSFSEAVQHIRELQDRDQSSKSSISDSTVQRNPE
jgi:glycosyltransferase involved in cell wall biosynthesis